MPGRPAGVLPPERSSPNVARPSREPHASPMDARKRAPIAEAAAVALPVGGELQGPTGASCWTVKCCPVVATRG